VDARQGHATPRTRRTGIVAGWKTEDQNGRLSLSEKEGE